MVPTSGIAAAVPPWELKATIYTFMLYTSAKSAKSLASDRPFLYSPLEAVSTFANHTFVGGLGMVQVIRYSESPVGPYDEFLVMPGSFEYEVDGGVKKSNARVTKIYVSTKESSWNGRTNWNIPKHLARFTFTDLPGGATAMAIYPHDNSSTESGPAAPPIFTATYKPISYLPSFSASTASAKLIRLDLSIVQPPLPAGHGSQNELPGTEQWCKCLPLEHSRKTSLGWWDLKQSGANEEDALLGRESDGVGDGPPGYDNFWPGIGRWRIGMKMDDATIKFPEGSYWDEQG